MKYVLFKYSRINMEIILCKGRVMKKVVDFDIGIRNKNFGDFAKNKNEAIALALKTGPGVDNIFRIALWLDPERIKEPVISLTTGPNHKGTHPSLLGERINKAIEETDKVNEQISIVYIKLKKIEKIIRKARWVNVCLDYFHGLDKKASSGRPIGEFGIPGVTLSLASYLLPSFENVNTMAKTFSVFGVHLAEHYEFGNQESLYMEKLLQAKVVCYTRFESGDVNYHCINVFSRDEDGKLLENNSNLTEQARQQLEDSSDADRLNWVAEKVTSIENTFGIVFDKNFTPSNSFNVTFMDRGVFYKIPFEELEKKFG